MARLESLLLIAYALSLPISMTLSWILLIALVCAAAVDTVRSEDARKILRTQAPLTVPICIFALAVAVSGLAHGGIVEAAASVFSLKALSCYFVASLCFGRTPGLAARSLSVLLPVAAAAGIFGTIQQLFDWHPFTYHYLQGTGFLGDPMAYAGQMQIFAMLALGLALTRGYKNLASALCKKTVFTAMLFCILLGLVFCGERSAWLGGAVAVLAATGLISRRLILRTTVVLALLATTAWFCIPIVHTRVQAMFDPQQDVSTQARLAVWHRAVDEWHRSPLIGVGFLNFPHLDIKEAIVPGRSKDLHHAHSNYLQMLATTGAIGLAAFIYLVFDTMRQSRRLFIIGQRVDDHFLQGAGIGLFAAMVSLAAAGLFEYNFGTAQVRLAQWFALALIAAVPRLDQSRQ